MDGSYPNLGKFRLTCGLLVPPKIRSDDSNRPDGLAPFVDSIDYHLEGAIQYHDISLCLLQLMNFFVQSGKQK